MKRVVLSSGLREADIRPPALMSEFKRLSIRDTAAMLAEPGALEAVPCPGCGRDQPNHAFERQEFQYVECSACGTLYVSPRPTAEALSRYYHESEASRFRVEHFSRDTAKARRYHLLVSHANWMGQIVDEVGNPGARAYGDVETYSPEIFDEIARLQLFDALYALDPLLPHEGEANVEVREDLSAPVPLGAVSAFEKLEHQHDPGEILDSLVRAIAPGGLLFLTTRTCSGFDLQVLWERAPYIFIPEHLNLLSIEGLRALIERSGLELVELSTPGQLDVEFVRHAREADTEITLPRFLRYLLDERDALAHEDFQAFLQKHRLSSHVRVAARKKEG